VLRLEPVLWNPANAAVAAAAAFDAAGAVAATVLLW
jgi:hypothetical protein